MKQFPEQIMPDGQSGIFCVAGFRICSGECLDDTLCLKDTGETAEGNNCDNWEQRGGKCFAGAYLMNSCSDLTYTGDQGLPFLGKKGNDINPCGQNGKQHDVTSNDHKSVAGGHENFFQGEAFAVTEGGRILNRIDRCSLIKHS